MSSLSAHLRQSEDHSQLRFHPGCPVCRRDRLAGSLTGDELVSRRVQAALAAGLMAFSTSGASVAVAQEPDEVSEGTSEVLAPGDAGSNADFDPGSEAIELPDEAPAAPEPAQPPAFRHGRLRRPRAGAGHGCGRASRQRRGERGSVRARKLRPPRLPHPRHHRRTARPRSGGRARRQWTQARARRAARCEARERAVAVAPAVDPAAAPAAPVAAAPAPAAPTTIRVVAGASTGQAAPGDRVHVVRRGESLWSIASDLLGDGASVARVAGEVNRLWELNEDRIGSGRPDLLYAGTRLRLR